MLFDLFRGGFSIQTLINLLTRVFVIICVLPIHEYAHAFTATKMGDQTARLSGRLTLNPFAHLDPIGALMIVLVGFGYAKPVPVNFRNFKNRKKGMAITALAGPASNIIMAFISILLMHLVALSTAVNTSTLLSVTQYFFDYCAIININLAVFNLLPIPPLDGSRLATVIFPDKIYYKIMQYERYMVYIILILLLTGILSWPLSFLSNAVYHFFNWLVSFAF